jgi:hypothetical protein
MTSLPQRLLGVAVAEDEAANALTGGSYRETVSGSVGRAAGHTAYGSNPPKWWAVHIAQPFINAIFGPDHCAQQAQAEAVRRQSAAQPPN